MEALLITKTAEWVRQRMSAEGSHDWFHVERVWRTARHLLADEAGREPSKPIDGLVV